MEVGIGTSSDVIGRFEGGLERPLHIGLSTANPNFTDQHAFELNSIFPLDNQVIRAAGFQTTECDLPFATFGFGFYTFFSKRHGYFLAFVSPTPNGRVDLLLQDHPS